MPQVLGIYQEKKEKQEQQQKKVHFIELSVKKKRENKCLTMFYPFCKKLTDWLVEVAEAS